MTRALVRDPIYRHRRFPPEVIETCVRWYLTYRLSYRDLVAMMAERDIRVSHSTILRWALRYVPEYERRWAQHAKPVNGSWRMDETFVPVRGGKYYLYRAVDKHGKSVDSMLSGSRDREAARAFFQQAVAKPEAGWPHTINVDGHKATHLALKLLSSEDRRWRWIKVRSSRCVSTCSPSQSQGAPSMGEGNTRRWSRSCDRQAHLCWLEAFHFAGPVAWGRRSAGNELDGRRFFAMR